MAITGNVIRWESSQDGLGNLVQTTGPIPTPGKDEVLVEIHAVSLNYRDSEGELRP